MRSRGSFRVLYITAPNAPWCRIPPAQVGLRQDPKIKRPNNATSAVADRLQLVLAGLFVLVGQTSSGRSQGFTYTAKCLVCFLGA